MQFLFKIYIEKYKYKRTGRETKRYTEIYIIVRTVKRREGNFVKIHGEIQGLSIGNVLFRKDSPGNGI